MQPRSTPITHSTIVEGPTPSRTGQVFRSLHWRVTSWALLLGLSIPMGWAVLNISVDGRFDDGSAMPIALRLGIFLLAVLSFATTARLVRAAVVLDDDGVTVRGTFRDRRIAWLELRGARLDPRRVSSGRNRTTPGAWLVLDATTGRPVKAIATQVHLAQVDHQLGAMLGAFAEHGIVVDCSALR